MRYGVYGKSNAILHAYLAHQLGHMGFDGALLDAQLGADFLVRPAYHQHLQNLLFPIRKGHAASRKDASRELVTRSMNIERTRRGAHTDPWFTMRIACTNSAGAAASST